MPMPIYGEELIGSQLGNVRQTIPKRQISGLEDHLDEICAHMGSALTTERIEIVANAGQ
jgi:hypothetical protein